MAAFALIVWYDRSHPRQLNYLNHSTVSGDDWEKYNQKTFRVVKVVDGDTIDINIEDGKYKSTRIRLIGVDTPETKKPNAPVMYFGPEASEFTRLQALDKDVTVFLDTVTKSRDRYGRLLAYIKLPNGEILNEVIISQGYGYAYTVFKHSFSNKYIQLQNRAKAAKRGLWKDVRPDQMPEWMQRRENQKKAA